MHYIYEATLESISVTLFLLKKAFHFLIITVMQGLMTVSDRDSILHGLDEIERRIEAGEFVWRMDREDVHMNIEAALTDIIGEPAKKLHTARSRNDQVVTDLRLWCREAIDKIVASIKQLQVHTFHLVCCIFSLKISSFLSECCLSCN